MKYKAIVEDMGEHLRDLEMEKAHERNNTEDPSTVRLVTAQMIMVTRFQKYLRLLQRKHQ